MAKTSRTTKTPNQADPEASSSFLLVAADELNAIRDLTGAAGLAADSFRCPYSVNAVTRVLDVASESTEALKGRISAARPKAKPRKMTPAAKRLRKFVSAIQSKAAVSARA